jgi:hypothetical protein
MRVSHRNVSKYPSTALLFLFTASSATFMLDKQQHINRKGHKLSTELLENSFQTSRSTRLVPVAEQV